MWDNVNAEASHCHGGAGTGGLPIWSWVAGVAKSSQTYATPPRPRTETCGVQVTEGKHTSAQQKPRQWYHRRLSARKKNYEKALNYLIYKTLPSNFEKTTVFSNVCFFAWD